MAVAPAPWAEASQSGHARCPYTVAQTRLLNELYDHMWLYYNFFQPVLRLVEKTSVPDADHGYKIKRRYDRPQTPFQRLCALGGLSAEQRNKLQHLYETTNPRQLRERIYAILDRLMALPNAAPNKPQDVLQTLVKTPQKGEASPVTLSSDLTTSL